MVDFLIVGTPKAGTTALQYYLSQHDEIFMPNVKEVHFFGEEFRSFDFGERKTYKYDFSLKEYENLFTQADENQIKGEASVFYLYSQSAIEEIKRYNPKMKIIVCLRNPVDFLTSYHQDSVYVGNEDQPNFWTALSLEEERRKGSSIPKSCTLRKALYYTELVKYKKYVEAYVEEFSHENVLPVIFEEFFDNPEQNFEKILKFLNVENTLNKEIEFKKFNPRRSIRLNWFDRFLKHPKEKYRRIAKVLLPSQQLRFLTFRFLRKLNTSHSQVNVLSLDEKKKLYTMTSSYINELEDFLHRDLSIWEKFK